MRSEIRTALAVLATAAVLMGSATMALAADGTAESDPTVATTTTSPSPSQSTTPGPTASTPTPDPSETTPEPTPTATTPTTVPSTAFEVTNALLRWGVNNESNNRGAAPGTVNLFSAGKIGNPDKGGQLLNNSDSGATWANGATAGWKARAGNVRIEKRQANGSTFAPATWAGTKTDKDGTALGGYATNTKFSDHQVALSGGTGEVDVAAKNATIRWRGDFTIIYYSGYSFFYVSDPKLTVTNGQGRVTAKLGGYASSMDDMDAWKKVPDAADVVIAELGTVDLSKDLGFTAAPKYAGVRVSGTGQTMNSTHPGSFPQPFITFASKVGIDPYWYSSGGSIDKNKPALPMAVSYDAGKPIVPPTPSGGKGSKTPDVTNDAPAAPGAPTPPSSAGQPPAPQIPPVAAVPAPSADDVLQTGATFTQVRPVSTVLGYQPGLSSPTAPVGIWILGGVLLTFALVVTASPYAYSAVRRAD